MAKTFREWSIEQSIVRALSDMGRTIRVPVHMVDTGRLLARTSRRLAQGGVEVATAAQLSSASGVAVEKVEVALRARHEPASLDSPIGLDGSARLTPPRAQGASTTLRARW